jgi:diacylglycerol kinase (ATP)
MLGTIHLFERLPHVVDLPIGMSRDWTGAPARSRPLFGVIRNLRSHRNAGRMLDLHDTDDQIIACPTKRGELPAILADFAAREVDYIVMDGGDGTVRDVLTCGAGIFGESWPGLIVIPSGKTNALAYDLGVPANWTLEDGIAAARIGNFVRRQPLVVQQQGNARAQVRGFVIGGGVFTRAITLGQKSHNMGAFNNAVVGLTALWTAAQAMLGNAGNIWRRGTRMSIRVDGQDLPHRGGMAETERYVLFGSTLRRFPAGLDPFRGVNTPMRMGVIDNAKRGLMLRLIAIFRGTASEATIARGVHVFGAETVEWEIGENFILDGEAFPAGHYRVSAGQPLRFVVP